MAPAMSHFGLRYRNSWIALRPGQFTIGRSNECSLFLDDAGASRLHARLIVGATEVVLEDPGSRNGIVLNGDPMTGKVALAHGDRIEIGAQALVFEDQRDDDEQTGERKKRRLRQTMKLDGPVPVGAGPDDVDDGATSRPDTALVEEAQQMLAQDDVGGAAGLMSIVVRRLVSFGERNKPVEKQILSNTSRCLVDLAAATEQWQWVDRLFEVHAAHGVMVASNVIDVVHVLAKELGAPRSRVIADYFALMAAQKDRLGFEERVVLQRLEGLAKLLQ